MGQQDDARVAWGRLTELFLSADTHRRFHDACDAIGLPHPGALKLLLLVDADQPPAMRDVADQLNCDASWVTNLVDALEDLGYAERVVSAADRRVKRIQLTPAGLAARDKATAVMAEPSPAMTRLSATETKALAKLLGKLTRPD
ncbi:MAG TPA: MarR family winged helix-turn-helix transcriptional regulator [Acidimicrobiales bacterium]|nr:MarR family winged helix-turn-helix transcriptional regulator [Acidimicrobiales bacterium]